MHSIIVIEHFTAFTFSCSFYKRITKVTRDDCLEDVDISPLKLTKISIPWSVTNAEELWIYQYFLTLFLLECLEIYFFHIFYLIISVEQLNIRGSTSLLF